MARKVRKVPKHASLIINAARRVFLSLREDLRQVEERFAGGSVNAFTMKLRDIQQSEAS